jgi:hypothetical protein
MPLHDCVCFQVDLTSIILQDFSLCYTKIFNQDNDFLLTTINLIFETLINNNITKKNEISLVREECINEILKFRNESLQNNKFKNEISTYI